VNIMSMKKEAQFEGYVSLKSLKPKIENGGIFFPISVEHVDMRKYHGDARSFGYNFDEGVCTVVKYEQVVGVLADDTIALFDECAEIKKYMKKPSTSILEVDENNNSECNEEGSKLLIRYDSDYLYKDENGYWLKSQYCSDADFSKSRVTEDSTEIYREVNKEYQRSIKKHNALMKEALENMKLLEIVRFSKS